MNTIVNHLKMVIIELEVLENAQKEIKNILLNYQITFTLNVIKLSYSHNINLCSD